MILLNIRQRMILCFFLYLIFYGVYGSLFIRDFKIFNEDVSLLMQVGKLNNICLEIRRYEKNFIIRHDEGDLQRVVEYLNEAQKYIPQLKKNVRAVAQPDRLNQLQKTLLEYENTFSTFRTECMLESSDEDCLSRAALREIGHELVSITDQLVQHEQRKMTDFVDSVRIRLFWAVAVLSVLSFLTL